MNAKTWTKKIVGTALLGVVIAGAGTTAALAMTPKAAVGDAPAGTYQLSEVTNLTPYTWTFLGTAGTGYDIAPPQTVAPGQTARWASHDVYAENWGWTYYTFTDSNGAPHTVDLLDGSTGYDNGSHSLTSYSRDGIGHNAPDSTRSFHMAYDPDGAMRHVDAVWNTPTSITIDGAKDPASAATIVNSQLPRVAAKDITFTPTTSDVTWTDVPDRQISSKVINDSTAAVTVSTSHATTKGEGTSFSEDTTVSLSTKIFGAASSVAATLTEGQSWSSSDSVGVTDTTSIDPGTTGWLVLGSSTATVTGDLVFTTPDHITYTIDNVAVSRGDLVNPKGTIAGGTYVKHECKVNDGSKATCPAPSGK